MDLTSYTRGEAALLWHYTMTSNHKKAIESESVSILIEVSHRMNLELYYTTQYPGGKQ